jgi:hypothetical protein
MLIEDEELKRRIESPSNLLNRLKTITTSRDRTSSLPVINIPALPPSADEVIDDIEKKITIGSIKGKALGIMSSALDELKEKLPEIGKPDKLSKVIADMSKVYDSVENRNMPAVQAAQIIIYAPQIVSEDTFNIVEMTD